jgi:hypothetical protein
MEEIAVGANLTLSGGTLSATGGGGTPGGSNAQLQFNNSGAFGGTAVLTLDGSNNVLAQANKFYISDTSDPTKQIRFSTTNIPTSSIFQVSIGGSGSWTVIPDSGAPNNFLTGMSNGIFTKAQPSFSNISGSLTGIAQNNLPVGGQIWVDQTNGLNVTCAKGNLARPCADIPTAFSKVSAGDIVYVGPGTFGQGATPLVIPAGVTLIGAGPDYTIITGSVGTTRAVLEPSTASAVYGLTVQNLAATGAVFGVGGGSAAFTSAYAAGIKLIGNSDCIYLNKPGTTGLVMENANLQSQFDTLFCGQGGTFTFRNCDFYADGSPNPAARNINVANGTVLFRDGSLTAINSTGTNVAVNASGASSVVELHNVAITRNSTGSVNFDLQQASSAVIKKDGVARTDGLMLSNNGTITELINTYPGNIGISAASKLLGTGSGSNGPAQEITLGTNLSMSGNTLNATGGGGGSPPGGSDTQVQYNKTGAFAGDAGLTYNDSTDALTVGGQLTIGGGNISLTTDDATNNAVTTIVAATHNTTGSPAAGLGTGYDFKAESSTTLGRIQGQIQTAWSDVTDATRTSYMVFRLNNAGSVAEKARLFASGGFAVNNTTDPGAGIIEAGQGFWAGNSAATSGKILKSDGGKYTNSTETYAAPGTAGNRLISDGINWTASPGTANPTALVGLAAVNGTSTNTTRADGAPALDQAIAPAWTGAHNFNEARTIASGASAVLDDVKVAANTTTVTGTTNITTAKGFNKVSIYKPTITDSSAVTITNAATLYIEDAPAVSGSAVITNPYALWVGNGNTKLNGTLTIAGGTVNAGTGFQIGGAAANGQFLRGNGSNFVSSTYTIPATAGTLGYQWISDSTNVTAQATGINNASTADQTGFASDTYLTGSAISVGAGDFKAKGVYHCSFDMAKTAAGTATSVVTVRIGTTASTLDAARLTFTFGAGTAAADTGTFDLTVVFRSVGSGTSAVVAGFIKAQHNLATTGLFNNAAAWTIVPAASSGFDSSAATKIGVSFSGGTSFSGTNRAVISWIDQPTP